MHPSFALFFFFFNDTATTEIYTLSLHDALPIFKATPQITYEDRALVNYKDEEFGAAPLTAAQKKHFRSEEHTSELQSPVHLVCRLLLEKKKKNYHQTKFIRTSHLNRLSYRHDIV